MSDKFVTFNQERTTPTGLPQAVETRLTGRYATKTELHSAIMGTGGVVGIGINRLVASLDHDTPLNDGDLLLKLHRPTEFFTDFSEYPLGQFPTGWTQRWKSGDWIKVVADPSATGGVVLREEGATVNNRALSWDRVGMPTDAEVVLKWKAGNPGAPPRAIVRGAGINIPTGYHGGSQNEGTSSLQAAVNSNESITLREVTRPFSGSVWYITRLRAVGSTISVKTWKADESEPTSWEFEEEDTSITESGWVGIRTYSFSGIRDFDWVGVAIDGGTAPMQPVVL